MKLSKLFQGKRGKKWTVAAACVAGLFLAMLSMVPKAVMTATTQRDLPIYCVQKDSKVCSLTFDAAWGNVKVRQTHTPWGLPHFTFYHYYNIDKQNLQDFD